MFIYLDSCEFDPRALEHAVLCEIGGFIGRPIAFRLLLEVATPGFATHLGLAGRDKTEQSEESKGRKEASCAHGNASAVVEEI